MKKIPWIVGILFLVQTSFGQYEWQNPKPSGNPLWDICFIDSTMGWVVGECGTILKSTDGGVSWTAQFSGTDSDLSAVVFYTSEVGFAVGENGTVLKTQNGGESWQQLNTGTGQNLTDVVCLDQDNLWIAGGQGVILHSYNGGDSWSEQFNLPGIVWVAANLVETEILGECIIRIAGRIQSSSGNVLITSVDRGGTWILQSIVGTYSSVRCLAFADEFTGWVGSGSGCDGNLLRTNDGGVTWTEVYSGGDVVSLRCINPSQVFCLLNVESLITNNRVIRSSDGGLTWDTSFIFGAGSCNTLMFIDSLTGWVAGHGPYPGGSGIYYTDNGGLTWETNFLSVIDRPVHDILFLDDQQGWAAANGNEIGGGRLYHTSDGGVTWELAEYIHNPRSIHFTDVSHGWVTGWKGVYYFGGSYDSSIIRRTLDGGETWIESQLDLRQELYRIFFIDQQTGWVIGNEGTILKSMDGGVNWETVPAGIAEDLFGLIFVNENKGWICGENGVVMQSVDGGENWTVQFSGTAVNLQSIDFIGQNHGCAVGGDGVILYTTNGGVTWKTGNSGTTDDLYDVDLYDELNGIAVGENGCVLKTHDGGMTWTRELRPCHADLKAVTISDPDNFWMGGLFHIIHQGDGQITGWNEIIHSDKELPMTCFPNPFSGTTKISFSIDHPCMVSISVYTISGQQIADPFSGYKHPGDNIVEFDGGTLPSGIYFCRLQAGDKSAVIRLIKL